MNVVVRIKPLGVGTGEEDSKNLTSTMEFDETSLKCKEKSYTFPKIVISPSTNQDSTYSKIMGNLIPTFFNFTDVNIIAYGQTSAGKTHTLLSPPKLLQKCAETEDFSHPDLGIFPRAVMEILEIVKKKKKQGIKCSLVASVIEVYMLEILDILNNKKPVEFVKNDCTVHGETEWNINSKKDIFKLCAMLENRTVGSTLMNDSSSRSHCIISLKYCERIKDTFRMSTLKIFDLGGSERSKTAHGEDVIPTKDFSALEGLSVNLGLFILLWSVEAFQKKKFAKDQKTRFRQFNNHLSAFWFGTQLPCLMHASLTGTGVTRMFINVSQAPKNAFQSNFALKFGEKSSKLMMKPIKNPAKTLKKEIQRIKELIKDNKMALERLKKNGNNKIYQKKRESMVVQFTNELKQLEPLSFS